MHFNVVKSGESPDLQTLPCAVLTEDNWNDWFEFTTMYQLSVYTADAKEHRLGDVKIGQFGMQPGQRRADIDQSFDSLDEPYFSLGQDDSYYERLNELPPDLKHEVLRGLNDIAFDVPLFDRASTENVTKTSLFRAVTESTVKQQFRRIISGGARLSAYHFVYRLPAAFSSNEATPLAFDVTPESEPPSNVHVVIGSNGVGKTLLLTNMARAILFGVAPLTPFGTFEFGDGHWDSENRTSFAGVVLVSFSAFDPFALASPNQAVTNPVRYEYIGLRATQGIERGTAYRPKSTQELSTEFAKSAAACRIGARVERWKRALDALETDPMFFQDQISDVAFQHFGSDAERDKAMMDRFDPLSSGHKLVLLTITRLVEVVEEATLVLIDEPEAHLHPPLLSTFIRALSELLINRNGVAIIATHSPVVLQEVPMKCVWKLSRFGNFTVGTRPEIETFGENVGVLTREVFGLEVTESGFHKMIANRARLSPSYEDAVESFGGQLGGEARALLRALMIEQEGRDEV